MDLIEYMRSLPLMLSKLDSSSKLHVTVGNESCDLDSMVSALCHAHYLHVKNGDDIVSLPLFMCKRAEFNLRPEAVDVLAQVGIQPDWLIFADDLTQKKMASSDKLKISLVDHNSPDGLPSNQIVEVIDHHQLSPDTCVGRDGVHSTVEPVGSCSTLVGNQLLSDEAYTVSESVAILLLSAILLDTGNLLSESIVTDKDKQVASKLQEILPKSFSSKAHFEKLFTSRFDISKLSTEQVLCRDFKQIRVCDKYSIGFSSVTDDLTTFVSRSDFNKGIASFYRGKRLDVLLLIGIHVPGGDLSKKQRQIAVYQPRNGEMGVCDLAESIESMLEANQELLCVRKTGVVRTFEGILLEQGNVKMSRKHILSMVAQFVKDVERVHSASHKAAQPPLEPVVTVVSTKGEPPIPEYSMKEETEEVRTHRFVSVAGEEHIINMTLVEPYKKIVQHSGYVGDKRMAVMVVSAHYLPPRSLHNYKEVAQELFYYIMSVLDRIIVDEYMIVYLQSGAPHNSRPSLTLLRKFYQLVDRRFRKQLMHLYLVHPTFLVKSMLVLARPFISTKFRRKVHFVQTLSELPSHVIIEDNLIPTAVKDADSAIVRHHPSSVRYSPTERETK